MLLSEFGIDETYLAHTPNETLIEHSNLTLEYLQKILKAKKLERLVDSLIQKIEPENFELLKELFVSAVYLHDTGKKNPYFQAKIMNNKLFSEYAGKSNSSEHSFSSSTEFIKYYDNKINILQNRALKEKFRFLLYAFSYHQAKHHGSLGAFEEYRKNEKAPKTYWSYLENFNIPHFEFYILNKLLFSLLVSSDYYATTEYMGKLKTDYFGTLDEGQKKSLRELFDNYISGFDKSVPINKLRGEIYAEAEQNLSKNYKKHIFYLEAPTGSGKTITSINLALRLCEKDANLDKIFYVFPFNTLAEQTRAVFDSIFSNSVKIETINSITPISIDETKQEDEETKYQRSYVNRRFFHSPIVMTTHVAFFNVLFGATKEDNFPLWQFANSVVILDEIQSYNNHLWHYMVKFFDKYASLLNIKIIIMSATLPKLDFFLSNKNSFVDLIGGQKRDYFFKNDLFAKRVEADYSLLERKTSFEELMDILEQQPKDKKILFEFIKKQSAREFYNLIKNNFKNVYELSGDDNKAYRQFVIDKSKEDAPIIIVATQVIEAGVDIDMDIGFKDFSTLDGEEQFMGRINRSCKKQGAKAYFFDLDDAEKIYRGDHRLRLDIRQEKYQEILKNKDFAEYYKEVLEIIKNQSDRFQNGLLTNYDNFAELVKKLDYKELSKTMTLINSQNFTLYFPFKLDISNLHGFKELDKYLTDGALDGQKVWDEFKNIDLIDGFAKKEVEKSKINSLMQFFTFSIFRFGKQQKPPFFSEEYGGYFFIANYADFISEDGKFDRAKYTGYADTAFL